MTAEAPSSPPAASKVGSSGWLDGVLVFALAYVYLELLPDCFDLFDEGLVAATAERLYLGQVLYRDVFSYWNPGVFWLQSALFSVAGVSVQTVRVPLLLSGAAAAVGVWRLARDHSGRGVAILAGLAVPLVCYPVWWMASPHWYSTFAAIAALLTLRHGSGRRYSPIALLATGAFCGVAFVFLQPVGAFLSVSMGAFVAWDTAWMESKTAALRRIALLAVGALVPICAMYGYFAIHRALDEMIYDTILWTLQGFRPSMHASYGEATVWMPNDLPFEATRVVLMVIPPVVIGWALFLTGSKYVGRTVAPEDRRLFALATISAGLLASNYYYPDVVHLAFAAPPAWALLAALLERYGTRGGDRRLARAGAALLLVFGVFAGLGSLHRQQTTCASEISTARGPITVTPPLADALQNVFEFMAEELVPGESLYVYPYGPGFSFLSGHVNPAPFEAVAPNRPLYTTEVQLDQVVSALEEKQVRYILLPHMIGRTFLERYDTKLEGYIRGRYHVLADFEGAVVMERDSPEASGPRIEFDPK